VQHNKLTTHRHSRGPPGHGTGGSVGVAVYCLAMAAKPEPGSLVMAAKPALGAAGTIARYVITRLGLVG
jgi:hypothetical protein